MFEKNCLILLILIVAFSGCTQIVIPVERLIPMMLIDNRTLDDMQRSNHLIKPTDDFVTNYQPHRRTLPPYHQYICIKNLDHQLKELPKNKKT